MSDKSLVSTFWSHSTTSKIKITFIFWSGDKGNKMVKKNVLQNMPIFELFWWHIIRKEYHFLCRFRLLVWVVCSVCKWKVPISSTVRVCLFMQSLDYTRCVKLIQYTNPSKRVRKWHVSDVINSLKLSLLYVGVWHISFVTFLKVHH